MSSTVVVRKLFSNLRLYEDSVLAVRDINAALLSGNECKVLAFLNSHAVNMAVENPKFLEALTQADFLLRDGVGVSILCRILGFSPGANLNGTDFIPNYLSQMPGLRLAVWGTDEPNLSMAIQQLASSGHDVVSVMDGFQEIDRYTAEWSTIDVDVVILAMGMPKQELVSKALRMHSTLGRGRLIICGGAILDFLSGNIARAPRLVRAMRLEWFYRLAQEPRRLWRRYLLGNVVFIYRIMLYKFHAQRGASVE